MLRNHTFTTWHAHDLIIRMSGHVQYGPSGLIARQEKTFRAEHRDLLKPAKVYAFTGRHFGMVLLWKHGEIETIPPHHVERIERFLAKHDWQMTTIDLNYEEEQVAGPTRYHIVPIIHAARLGPTGELVLTYGKPIESHTDHVVAYGRVLDMRANKQLVGIVER